MRLQVQYPSGRLCLQQMMSPDDEHARAVARWRQAREARLRAPGGWLSLVDRIPLDEGENQLPIGTVVLRGREARFHPRPDRHVTCDGVPVGERLLRADDGDGAAADLLLCDGRSYELVFRDEGVAIRIKDPHSPALAAFHGLKFFPIDRRFRVVGHLERRDGNSRIPGLVQFAIDGRPFSFEATREDARSRLFFAFTDETNRDDTYPGGRYLYAELPAGDQATEVILDFNTAFNPPCAFTPFVVCPVPPARNHLPVRIPAGERRYDDEATALPTDVHAATED